jgi:TPR repeat protein
MERSREIAATFDEAHTLFNCGRVKEARTRFKEVAESGKYAAWGNVAACDAVLGDEQGVHTSMRQLQKVADSGDAECAFVFFSMTQIGLSTSDDDVPDSVALGYLRIAAKHQNPFAQAKLADAHLFGDATGEEDIEGYLWWLREALDRLPNGAERAQEAERILGERGIVVPPWIQQKVKGKSK